MSHHSRYGWIPDVPDQRDHVYSVAAPRVLPAAFSLRSQCPPEISDQGALGSCTANAIGAAIEFDLIHQRLPVFRPSRLFVYYNERRMEGTVLDDAGAAIRDGIKSLYRFGVCSEDLWPYSDANPGPFSIRPSMASYQEALKHRVVAYQRLSRSLNALRACIAGGFPFVFGFSVYEGFESLAATQDGVLSMPHIEERLLGGHAVLAVGYDDADHVFEIRNSYGPNWGKNGYFTIPYDYVLNESLSDDFWTVRALRG